MPNKKYRKHKKSSVPSMLTRRLLEIEITPEGLPPFVLEHLENRVDAEIAKASNELDAKIVALKKESDSRLREMIEQIITPQTIGRAFAASIPSEAPVEVRSHPDAAAHPAITEITLGSQVGVAVTD